MIKLDSGQQHIADGLFKKTSCFVINKDASALIRLWFKNSEFLFFQ